MDRFSRTTVKGAPPVYRPGPRTVAAPLVYRPQFGLSAQPKSAGNFRVETRPAPPVYRPGGNAPVMRSASVGQKGAPPAYRPATLPVRPPIQPRNRPTAVLQRMIQHGSGGFGGDGGDGGDGDKWKPWEPSGKLIMIPRTKGAGGKHLVPANWIDRLFAVVVQNCSNLGIVENFISDVQDLIGEDTPLEISFYKYTSSESSQYVSVTNSGEKGFFQVIHAYKDKLREWAQNIYSHKIKSTGDRGGRQLDIPDSSVGDRLQRAAESIVRLFDKWLNPMTMIALQDGKSKTWKELRAVILSGVEELPDFEPKQYTEHGLKPGVYDSRDLSQATVVALINRAAEKDRGWALNLIELHKGNAFAVYQFACEGNMRLGVMDNGDVWLVLRGG